MALTKLITSGRLGASFPNAYGRVMHVGVSRKRGGGHSVMIDVAVYAQSPATEEIVEVDFLRYHLNLGELPDGVGANPINRAYAYLKSLPEWADASDV